MKIDLRKFRFWFISFIIKEKTNTRKEANSKYLEIKKSSESFDIMMEIYQLHLRHKKIKEEKKLLDLAQELRTLR